MLSNHEATISKDKVDADNLRLINGLIEKYAKKNLPPPVKNRSIEVESENITYKLIRLTDEQYFAFGQNSLAISPDYAHIIDLFGNNNLIFNSYAAMYVSLKRLFGRSGKYYDHWKGAFSFPFLIYFERDGRQYGYLLKIFSIRSSIEYTLRKLISADENTFDREVLHEPFKEFPREEIRYFIDYFIGFISGSFEVALNYYDESFYGTSESNGIIFGFCDGQFFDKHYKSTKSYQAMIKKLEEKGIPKINT